MKTNIYSAEQTQGRSILESRSRGRRALHLLFWEEGIRDQKFWRFLLCSQPRQDSTRALPRTQIISLPRSLSQCRRTIAESGTDEVDNVERTTTRSLTVVRLCLSSNPRHSFPRIFSGPDHSSLRRSRCNVRR